MVGLVPAEAHRAAHKDLVVAEEGSLPKAAPSCRLAQEEGQVVAGFAEGQVPSLTIVDLGVQWLLDADTPEDGHQWAWEQHQRH